jgi:hypothetical protein
VEVLPDWESVARRLREATENWDDRVAVERFTRRFTGPSKTPCTTWLSETMPAFLRSAATSRVSAGRAGFGMAIGMAG